MIDEADPYDYPRCEICKHCAGPNKCTHPSPPRKMAWDYMTPAGNYDSYCVDGFEKDPAALRAVHVLAGEK